MKTYSEQFTETYYDVSRRMNHLNDKNRYYMAVAEFEEAHRLKAPYSNYESFKAAISRKHNSR